MIEKQFTALLRSFVQDTAPKTEEPWNLSLIHIFSFLDGLLYTEDIPTLQEFIGYCLIPSNKGQRMMVIKGNGGEGKSQIGAVLSTCLLYTSRCV